MTARATRTSTRLYSRRPWPSKPFRHRRASLNAWLLSPMGNIETSLTKVRLVSKRRLGAEAGCDLVEDPADLAAEDSEGNDRDDRNEHEDQGVLNHALAFELFFRSVKAVQRAKILNHSRTSR